MNLREVPPDIGSPELDSDALTVFGAPFQTPDGATVIPVSKPAGVFVVNDGKPIWLPAVDATRIALMGILVGLVATALAGIAMVRRPPWPDLRRDITRLG